ncbi:MAG TPA: hypothetical protein VLC09_15315 [Polyangiaceae bacterium]|nr:hypothetical protein [Polyangiaceae bacterium]
MANNERGEIIGRYVGQGAAQLRSVAWSLVPLFGFALLKAKNLQHLLVLGSTGVALFYGVRWLAGRLGTTTLYTNGIKGMSSFIARPFVRWDAVTRSEWIAGNFLEISSAEADMLLPAELSKDEAFLSALRARLGNEHRIVRLLEQGPPPPSEL